MSGYVALTAVIGVAASIGCASSRPAEKVDGGRSTPPVDSTDTRASIGTSLAELARVYAPPAGLSVGRHVPPFPAARQEILTLSRGPEAVKRRPAVIWRLRDGTIEPVSTTYGPSPETDYLESVLAVMANV